jgi:two-component system response regulator RegX3
MENVNGNILVIEDVPELADITARYLEKEGFTVKKVESAEDAFLLLDKWKSDLLILDINLPGIDGFEFLEKFRKCHNTPVLIVSARTAEDDQVTGLVTGADEYITKPFSPRILTARVRAMFRRIDAETDETLTTEYRFGPFILDTETNELKKDSENIPLTAKEYAVLLYLAESYPKPSTPEKIYDTVWKGTFGDLVTVPVHIQRLRKKIEKNSSNPEWLITVRGFGYKLVLNEN